MRVILLDKVLDFPNQAVALARRQAVRPKVRPPKQQGHLDLAFGQAAVQGGVALDLPENQVTNDEGVFVSIRLQVQSSQVVSWSKCSRGETAHSAASDTQTISLSLRTYIERLAKAGCDHTTGRPGMRLVGSITWARLVS
jgi:hypothetical protein